MVMYLVNTQPKMIEAESPSEAAQKYAKYLFSPNMNGFSVTIPGHGGQHSNIAVKPNSIFTIRNVVEVDRG